MWKSSRGMKTSAKYRKTSTQIAPLTFVCPVGNGHRHVLPAVVVLRFGGRGGEAADARLRRRAEGGHAVRGVVGTGGHLVRWAVGDEALCNGELGVLQVLLQLGVLVRSGQLLVGGGGALRRHHAVTTLIWKNKGGMFRNLNTACQYLHFSNKW